MHLLDDAGAFDASFAGVGVAKMLTAARRGELVETAVRPAGDRAGGTSKATDSG